MTDWVAWHAAYDDPTSSLARRLPVVRARIAQALDLVPTERPRLLSLCAGDGRDALPVIAGRPAVRAVLVERDPVLAERARHAAPTSVEVRCADASDQATVADVLPVDVLLLCGIFGNVDLAGATTLIDAAPRLLVDGGAVVWTRGRDDPDPRPVLRERFDAAGFEEIAFDGEPEAFGVGLHQLAHRRPAVPALPDPLFTFVRR